MKRASSSYVLGVHPSSRGFGWVLLEDADSAFDWGTADVRAAKNAEALARVELLLKKYHPRAIAMEAFADKASQRAPRIRALCQDIVAAARSRKIAVLIYPKTAIRAAFPRTKTRQDVVVAVAAALPALKPRIPKPRKAWDSERANAALFTAAACALTYFAARKRTP